MIRVILPYHLRALAKIQGEVCVDIEGEATLRGVLDVLEDRYPMLRGTIRDQSTGTRRAYVRFFACQQDWSNCDPETPLPPGVARGDEPLLVVGAIAGG